MRVLGSSVLALEWIVIALGVPVAVNVSRVRPGAAWIVLAIVTVLTVAALALLPRPAGVWLGWAVQAVALAAGVMVPMLGILGLLFAGLYFAADRMGTRVDAVRAERVREQAERAEHVTG